MFLLSWDFLIRSRLRSGGVESGLKGQDERQSTDTLLLCVGKSVDNRQAVVYCANAVGREMNISSPGTPANVKSIVPGSPYAIDADQLFCRFVKDEPKRTKRGCEDL